MKRLVKKATHDWDNRDLAIVYINGEVYDENHDFPEISNAGVASSGISLESGEYFILGDNRPQASDSRTFGCIDLNDVKGKVIAVIRTRGI